MYIYHQKKIIYQIQIYLKYKKQKIHLLIQIHQKNKNVDEIEETSFKRQRKSSYEPPKTCKLIEEISTTKKEIKLYQEYDKYMIGKGNNNNKGFIIKNILSNEFGNALNELGINIGWKIISCSNKKLGNKSFIMLKNQISAASKSAKNGYNVIFENMNITSSSSSSSPKIQQAKDPFGSSSISKNDDKENEEEIESKTFVRQRKSSYEPPKTCELIENISLTKKKIKLYQEYDKYMIGKGNNNNKGFIIKNILSNEFGNALNELGINIGWKIISCANKKLGNKSFIMLKNQISAASKSNKNGYDVIFVNENIDENDNNNDNDDDEEKNFENKKKIDNDRPISPRKNKQSIEIIEDNNNIKTIILHHSIEKYIKGEAYSGGKGYKIKKFNKMFGNDLKEIGIDINWQLIKLGKKDVSKMFFTIIRTNLGVEWRNNQHKGFQVTFISS